MSTNERPRGFVDIQVNGFRGVDFSAPGLTEDNVRQVVTDLRNRGTVGFCPTVITSSLPLYEANLPVLASCMEQKDIGSALLGIHLEGPFISPLDGFRGAHPLENVAPPSVELLDQLRRLSGDRIRILTLAPEQPGAVDVIRHACKAGITVALGHHKAGRDTIRRACDAGAVSSTHLGNGVPNMLPRHPNPLWDQLDEERLTATLITDGQHLPPSFIRVAVRAKPLEQVVVISDAAPLAGFPPGEYETLGQRVVLEESGRIWNPIGNHLVGSSASLFDCMNFLGSLGIFDEEQLWQVGAVNPLRLIGAEAPSGFASPRVRWSSGRFELAEALS